MSDSMNDTAEFTTVSEAMPVGLPQGAIAVCVECGAASHKGLVRANNEDNYAVVRRTRSREILLTSVDTTDVLLADTHAYVLIVADGVGGRGFGELASELVLRIGWELSGRQPAWLMRFDPTKWPQYRERVEEYVRGIQAGLREYARANPKLAGMGSTWTCAYTMEADALIANLGDSRAYLFRQGELRQLTHDHTFAQELQDLGSPPEETKRFRHILTNSFGGSNDEVETEVAYVRLEDGNRLLLCTDGLTDMQTDEQIAEVLRETAGSQAACDVLLDRALRQGGKDNVTVIIARYEVSGATG